MRVTLRDVAKVCGLSVNTVSAVLNQKGHLYRPETRDLVLKTARELDYRPNLLARGLKTQRSGLLGVITWDLSLQTRVHKLSALQSRAVGAHYQTLIGLTRGEPQREELIVQQFMQICDALLLICDGRPVERCLGERTLAVVRGTRRPLLLLDSRDSTFPCVSIDRLAGVAEALAQCGPGYDELVFVAGRTPESDVFWQGLQELVTGQGLQLPLQWLHAEASQPGQSFESGYRAGDEWSRICSGRALAVCRDDRTALGLMKRLQERGLKVPADAGVLGFDDDVYAPFVTPSLSSVAQPNAAMADAAISWTLDLIAGASDRPPIAALQTVFVRRESC